MNTIRASENQRLSPLAPLIKESWYVIDAEKEFTREIKHRTVLNEPLIYYRTEAGAPVVMDGRCPHRRFPLSEGTLKGDSVACGYHGFTFGPDGKCSYAPGCPNGIPENIKIKIYSTAHAGPWVWVWMGEGEPDLEALPMPMDIYRRATWHYHTGCCHYNCNYGLVHENLLDLSHTYFLHKVGTFEYADAPLRFLGGGRAGWTKSLPEQISVFGYMTGAGWHAMTHWDMHTEVVGPGLMYTYIDIKPIDQADNLPTRGLVLQAVTPETDSTSFQFWFNGNDTAMVVSKEDFDALIGKVYGEDIAVLNRQQTMIANDRRQTAVEVSIPNDRSGFMFRRKIAGMAAGKKFSGSSLVAGASTPAAVSGTHRDFEQRPAVKI